MALYKRPIDEILLAIKTLNNVNLVEGEYTFGTPTAVSTSDGGPNTSLLVTALNPLSPYDGNATIRYNRLNLADLGTLISLNIRAWNITTKEQFAALLSARYGLDFQPGDIVTGAAGLTNGSGDLTIAAQANSMGWIGSVTFHVTKGAQPLSEAITVSNLPGINYPAPSLTKPYASVGYSYWRDYSPYYDTLKNVVTGTDSLSVVKDALVAASGDAWQLSGASRFSLDGATVSYVGDTASAPVSNPDYASVIIVDLNDTYSLGWTGQLIMHFGPPVVHNDD